MSVKRTLRRLPAPDEHGAEERAWRVIRSAYESREAQVDSHHRGRYVVALMAALALGAGALSPAGATVGHLITRALGIQNAAPRLSSLPASGRLLISSPEGTWTIAADGSVRRLGPWPQASWSPHGLYLAASRAGEVSALNPRGGLQWALRRPGASEARWYTPTGYRVAYLSGGDLRVVAGDGSGDHLVARDAARVAPAWRPAHPYQLAYVTSGGKLAVRDGDSRQVMWSRAEGGAGIHQLQWSVDGRYLLTVSPATARLYTARGHAVWGDAAPGRGPILDGSLSPDGGTVALVVGGSSPGVVLEDARPGRSAGAATANLGARRVLTGAGLRQVLWSPDGHWLLVSWPAANQLVFVRVTGRHRVAAVSHVSQQFSAGGNAGAFPRLEGWCCTAGR